MCARQKPAGSREQNEKEDVLRTSSFFAVMAPERQRLSGAIFSAVFAMCHFPALAGQPEMLHKNFMHRCLRMFGV